MTTVWLLIFGVMWSLRGAVAVALLLRGDLVSLSYGAFEVLALVFGLLNAITATRFDVRPLGLVVPTAYLLGAVLLPVSEGVGAFGIALLVAGFVLHNWALLILGRRWSVACVSWVSLCDVGPYAWVRHPQALSRILVLVAAATVVADLDSAVRVAACMMLVPLVVWLEEGFLREFAEYRSYEKRVPSALIPGLW